VLIFFSFSRVSGFSLLIVSLPAIWRMVDRPARCSMRLPDEQPPGVALLLPDLQYPDPRLRRHAVADGVRLEAMTHDREVAREHDRLAG
jgi:hypothetical protein